MKKDELRQQVLEKMKHQELQAKAQADHSLMNQLCHCPAYQQATTIATYLSMENEVNTAELLQRAQKDGKRVVVPKVVGKGKMIFVAYNQEDLERSRYGILEPRSNVEVPKSQIDFIHVPGVVFNSDGYRIGYGGGFYDRYLQDYTGMTGSTIYACQQGDFQPDDHDIAVQEVWCV